MRLIDWLALVGLAFAWGTSFFWVELAIPSFQPFTLVCIRVGVATLLMVVLLRRRPLLRLMCERWRIYSLLGLLGSAFPFLCFAWGQRHIESGMASIINALTPLLALALALGLGRERFNFMRLFGIVTGFVGVVVLVNPETGGSEVAGIFAAALAAFSYAVAANLAWGRVSHFPPKENATGQLFFATLFTLPFAFWEQPWREDVQWVGVFAMLALAVLSTFLAYLLYYFILKNAGGVNAVLGVLFVPAISITLGVLFLDERFDSRMLMGGVLIIAGVIVADEKLRRLLAQLGRRLLSGLP